MQSIFRLPWCSDQFVGKLADKPALDKMRSTPVVEIPIFNKLKRMRSNSTESLSPSPPQQTKKPRQELPADRPPYPVNARMLGKEEIGTASTQKPYDHLLPQSDVVSSSHKAAASGLVVATSDFSASADTKSETDQQTSLAGLHNRRAVGATNSLAFPSPSSTLDMTDGRTRLQQVIENECNLQILMKHNELRLIEQELAKCQIALEQLRRCELRPYPGSSMPLESVSTGTGSAIIPSPGFSRPTHPAPHGVTDGPYSRHYRQWLLQDPQFDSMSPQALALYESNAYAASRSTRNSGSAKKSVGKSLGTPSRHAELPQTIPNYPSAPRDKSAPLVLKRSTDGQLVKLICNNCHRGNFSSIQGFLNHCRIAHKVDYKSHDQAAIDCGRPLDENEVANLPAESHATHTPKPSVGRASGTTSATSTATPSRNLVHPLNTTVAAASRSMTSLPSTSATASPAPSLVSPAPQTFSSVPFKPSSQVPRLSAHFAKHRLGGDLELAASGAMQTVDLGYDDELPSPDTPEMGSPVAPMAGSRTIPGAATLNFSDSTPSLKRPPSRKGHRQPLQQRHRPSPLAPSALSVSSDHHHDMMHSPRDHSSSVLSPHAADSNPGLVSDHEDDDHGSVSEMEAPHSAVSHPLSPVARHCSDPDHMDIDVVEDDEMNRHGLIIRRNSVISAEPRDLRNAGSPSRKLKSRKGSR